MSSSEQPVPAAVCNICDGSENLMRCAKCKLVLYCSKDHQVKDWKSHKKTCKKFIEAQSLESSYNRYGHTHTTMPYTTEGSSEMEILSSASESLNNNFEEKPYQNHNKDQVPRTPNTKTTIKHFSEVSLNDGYSVRHNIDNEGWLDLVDNSAKLVIRDMNTYGVCVLDNFLGLDKGMKVLEEVKNIKEKGILQDGQVVKKGIGTEEDTKTIRSDKICWVDGKEIGCENIGKYMIKVDAIINIANGKLGQYNISGRTKAMVACYPGNGSHYVQHVDNPNKDGRCITSIYYLNPDWTEKCGGVLWIFPDGSKDVCKVKPIFDRLLLFWSDRRNPHEVRPALCDRFAITLWYFDEKEGAEARKRFAKLNAAINTSPPST